MRSKWSPQLIISGLISYSKFVNVLINTDKRKDMIKENRQKMNLDFPCQPKVLKDLEGANI